MMTNKRRTHWMIRGLGVSLLGGLSLPLLPSVVTGAYPLPAPDPRCNKCPDGVCVPNRFTYGYYAPKWRKWPGTALAPEMVPTPPERRSVPDDVPSPDQTPTDQGPDERPQETPMTDTDPTPDTMPDIPSIDVPSTTVPDASGQQLPPPTIDSELENILEDDSPQSSPSTDIPLIPETDSSPMPPDTGVQGIPADDDPFKDDEAPQSRFNGSDRRRASAFEQPVSGLTSRRKAPKVRWRGPQLAESLAVESKHHDRAVMPAAAIEHRPNVGGHANPLRSRGAAVADRHVAPAVDSSSDDGPEATQAVWRSNPLR